MDTPSPVTFKKQGPSGPSPTQRTFAWLRAEGYHFDIVERRHPVLKHVSRDYLGVIDIIAVHPSRPVLGVQSTGSAFAAHLEKLTVTNARSSRIWLEGRGTELMLIGWRRVKAERGKEPMVWRPRIKMITLEDLAE